MGGAPNAPDWQAEGFGAVWVANSAKNAVQRIDPTTNRVTAVVPIGAQPCDGLATGFGSVWAVDCAGALVRIDPSAGRVVARIAVTAESDEGLIATGEGGVWILSSLNANHDALIRIDPATNKVGARVLVPVGSTAAAVGFGSVWVTTAAGSSVERVDPSTGKVAATIRVHAGPRFLATGEGAVWVLNQSDGSVSRIDPRHEPGDSHHPRERPRRRRVYRGRRGPSVGDNARNTPVNHRSAQQRGDRTVQGGRRRLHQHRLRLYLALQPRPR